MSTLHISEQTNGRVLPQPVPLESVVADNPGVGTKRTIDTGHGPVPGVQHDRGETPGTSPSTGGVTADSSSGLSEQGRKTPHTGAALVPVLGSDGKPLMPTHPARARKLLASGRAVVARQAPFIIRLKDRKTSDGHTRVQPVGVGIDPGSKHTGMTVFTIHQDAHRATGRHRVSRRGMFALQLNHRGHAISQNLTSRAQLRRGRRSRNLRYRAPRFNNRTRPRGWLAPSLGHRVDGIMGTLARLRRWFPITEVHQELVRFDLQRLGSPDISGDQYQQGELFGFEVREYVLERDRRTCAYCDASGVVLNLDHVHPRSRGGSNRVSNLVLACVPCNMRKSNQLLDEFVTDPARLERIRARVKAPLNHAAAVNTTRWALWDRLQETGLPVHAGSGGRTKYQRHHHGLPKTHVNDALVSGRLDNITRVPVTTVMVQHTGRGTYQRVLPDRYGFPRAHRTRTKTRYGFITGDLVRAVVPTGKKAGTHTGRVAVRASGSFNITTPHGTIQGIGHRHVCLLQRGDGYAYGIEVNQ